jgi:hypothetical protein
MATRERQLSFWWLTDIIKNMVFEFKIKFDAILYILLYAEPTEHYINIIFIFTNLSNSFTA